MKKIFTRVIAAVVLAAATVLPAAAGPIKFGPKVGLSMNSFHMSQDAFSSDNRTGFTAGVMAEFTVPVIGIGVDLSAMYVHRESSVSAKGFDASEKVVSNFIDIPLHLKYKFGLPVVGHFLAPFVFTGPDFAFNLSKKTIEDMKKKNCDVIWDFGIGIEFFNHLQIAASYGLGCTKAVSWVADINGANLSGRNNCWTVTAAYLF